MNALRLSPDVAPIFFAHVFIDLDGRAAAVSGVATAAFGAGDPNLRTWKDELLRVSFLQRVSTVIRSGTRSNSSFHVWVVVGFEALALEARR